MNQSQVEAFVSSMENVQRDDSYGYIFYFVGDDHRLPFVTLADSDNEYDSLSNLNREGVYRVNIGVSRQTFESLFPHPMPETIDYTALNVFLPHPEYAKQHFICILNPSEDNDEAIRKYLLEAHALAAARLQRRTP